MVQNTMRALPGSLSGGRSTIAEYSERSRGIIGLAMTDVYLVVTDKENVTPSRPHATRPQMSGQEMRQEFSTAHSRESGNPGRRVLSLLPLVRGDERKRC